MPLFRSRLRHLALWLAVAGVLLRGLVPAGLMPAGGASDGRGWLTICRAGELAVLLPGGDAHDRRAGETHLGCPFAAAAAPGLPSPPGLPAMRSSTIESIEAAFAPSFDRLQRRLAPARAPPLAASI